METKEIRISPRTKVLNGKRITYNMCSRTVELTLEADKFYFTSKSEKKYLKHIYNSLLDLWFLCRNKHISLESCGCCNSIFMTDFSEKKQEGILCPITDLNITPTKMTFTSLWYEEE